MKHVRLVRAASEDAPSQAECVRFLDQCNHAACPKHQPYIYAMDAARHCTPTPLFPAL